MMKSTFRYFSLLLVIVFANFADAQEAFENKDLPNFSEVNAKLFRGAQPSEAGVRELAKLGVKTIIDLRGEDKLSEREAVWAKDSGIKFIGVSMNNLLRPKTSEVREVLDEINNSENQPVFIHCQRGADRTGTIVAAYRISHDNWTAKQAIDEAKKFDFGWWQFLMKDYINDYYRDFKSGKLNAGN